MEGKDDEYLADIFDGKADLTPGLEERLYRRYWGKLMGVAQRYVRDRETAREVVNDSFIKAFDKLATFRGDGEDKPIVLEAWLVRITINTAIDGLRAQQRLPELVSVTTGEDHPLVEMDDNLQMEDMLGLLRRLPTLHRIVFNLYELEGFSHDEIGKMLGIPVSSSRVYLTKAKQELRALYIKYFGGAI